MATGNPASKPQQRGRPSQEEAIEKKRGIISAGTELFLTVGYREASMRDVAQRAGVSTRTLYNLYADKASLFLACLDSVLEETSPVLVEGTTVEETLRGFAINMVRILSRPQSLGLARLVMNDGKDLPELAAAGYENQEKQFLRPLVEFMRANQFSAEEVEPLAKVFIAMAISEWNRSVTFHLPLPDDAQILRNAEWVTDLFLRGAMSSQRRS